MENRNARLNDFEGSKLGAGVRGWGAGNAAVVLTVVARPYFDKQAWEHAEGAFAHLFGTIIRPTRNSYAARRACGAITSSLVHRQILEAVGAVFFRDFPNTETQDNMKLLLTHYISAGARRNEIAHGIVGGDRGDDGGFLGYFIVPSAWTTKKRDLDSAMSYRYSCKEIHEKKNGFNEIGGRAIAVADQIDAAFQSFPEKHRRRW